MGKRNENNVGKGQKQTNNSVDETVTIENTTTIRAAKAGNKNQNKNQITKSESRNTKTEKENSQKKSKNSKSNKKGEKNSEEPKFFNVTEEDETNNYDIKESYEKSVKEVNNNISKLINEKQIKSAVQCIVKIIKDAFQTKNSLNLLSNESEEFIYLNFVLGKLPSKYSLRPVSVQLTNPIFGKDQNTRVCLFVKDPRSEVKDLKVEFPFKVKVLDIEKLKIKYSRFNERRDLFKEYEVFLCDYKVYFLLKKLLGKPFYSAKKYPIPIAIDTTDKASILKEVTNKIDDKTTFYMSNGPNYSVKVARVTQKESEIEENMKDAIKQVTPNLIKWGLDLSA